MNLQRVLPVFGRKSVVNDFVVRRGLSCHLVSATQWQNRARRTTEALTTELRPNSASTLYKFTDLLLMFFYSLTQVVVNIFVYSCVENAFKKGELGWIPGIYLKSFTTIRGGERLGKLFGRLCPRYVSVFRPWYESSLVFILYSVWSF